MSNNLIRQFIFAILSEGSGRDIPFNSWLRRPKNNYTKDLGADLELNRQQEFERVEQDFHKKVEKIQHDVKMADSISEIDNMIYEIGIDIWDVVTDSTMFQSALDKKNIKEVKRQITQGLDKWAEEALTNTRNDNFNISTLTGFLDD